MFNKFVLLEYTECWQYTDIYCLEYIQVKIKGEKWG